MLNISEVVQQIRSVGANNSRIVPISSGGNTTYKIEINESGAWRPVIAGVNLNMAEDMMRQAVNRVILG